MNTTNNLYPIFLKLKDKQVLIIGGGLIALQKLVGLINTEAKLKVIAPTIIDEIYECEGEFPYKRKIEFIEREYDWGDELNSFLVIAATNNPEMNNAIANRCRDQGILVNSVDEPEHCDFYVASIVEYESIKIAISTNGDAPSVAQKMRLDLQRNFVEKYSKLIPVISEFRTKVQEKISDEKQFSRRSKLIRWFTERQFKKLGKEANAEKQSS